MTNSSQFRLRLFCCFLLRLKAFNIAIPSIWHGSSRAFISGLGCLAGLVKASSYNAVGVAESEDFAGRMASEEEDYKSSVNINCFIIMAAATANFRQSLGLALASDFGGFGLATKLADAPA